MAVLSERFSIYRQYLFFAVVAPALLLILSLAVGWGSYHRIEEERRYRYGKEAEKAATALMETVLYIENFSRFLGKAIVQTGKNDAVSVNEVLQTHVRKDRIKQDIFTWTMFDFVNPEGKVIAASSTGVLPSPMLVDKSKRSWIESAPKKPWELHLDPPDIGITSGEWVIPTGFGITDNHGRFFGILSMGINIRKLTTTIQNTLSEDTDFLLLTSDFTIITSSSQLSSRGEKAPFAMKLMALEGGKRGFLPEKIHYQDIIYSYYKPIDNYRYLLLVGDNVHTLNKEFKRIVLPQILQTLLLGTFLLVLLYFFRSRILQPIMQLSQVAERLAAGQTDVIIPSMRSSEASTLADAFSRVKDYQKALSDANAAIRQMNITLEKRVMERTQALEESIRSKEEFLNTMSHEIRTPVACIQLRADLLLEEWEKLEEPVKLEWVSEVREGCLRLFSLLNNLLDLARFRSGKMAYRMQQEKLTTIVERIIQECQPLLNKKGLNAQLLDRAGACSVVCDATRIGQVIRNLLANAVKFMDKGTLTFCIDDVFLTTKTGEVRAVKFALIDEGSGIPQEELSSIFSAFTQSSTIRIDAGGTGLGLKICQEIITAHQGKIWAENNKNGVGAVFSFIIPQEQQGEE